MERKKQINFQANKEGMTISKHDVMKETKKE